MILYDIYQNVVHYTSYIIGERTRYY